jgi:CHAD domain-containing protein
MSYRLKVKEHLVEGLQRVALEQIDLAERELRGNADGSAAVHNARRALKRLRALLRLVRPGLDEIIYRREAQRFAEIGRQLAGARDQHVMQQTLKMLAAKADFPASLVPAFEALLARGTPAGPAPDPRAKAAGKLAASRRLFSGGTLEVIDREHVFQGLEVVYRKARRLHRQCHEAEATDEDFHALRKSVQQHWRHMQLLSRAWPEALSARADEAKALSQLLGEDHDLHVIRSFATAHADALPEEGLDALARATLGAQSALRQRARLHGDRLFAERARELVARLRTYWTVAHGLSALREIEPETTPEPPAKPALKPRVRQRPGSKRTKAAAPRASRVTTS